VLAHQRHLEQIWHGKKVKLHQRLGLRLFQQDVKQVIDWLNNHGDVFLKKNTSIGKSLQRAKALQKSHEHFESVARIFGTKGRGRQRIKYTDSLNTCIYATRKESPNNELIRRTDNRGEWKAMIADVCNRPGT
ncbi:triple functional domain protein-like protein, partial [Plakobranchus ocellatus]